MKKAVEKILYTQKGTSLDFIETGWIKLNEFNSQPNCHYSIKISNNRLETIFKTNIRDQKQIGLKSN